MKENFRPVSILPTLSKNFEKICLLKCLLFSITFFRIKQCGFRKGHSTQHCLLIMLTTWKRSVNKLFGALLTDPSKGFDCLDHELLTAKLHAYGFSLPAL